MRWEPGPQRPQRDAGSGWERRAGAGGMGKARRGREKCASPRLEQEWEAEPWPTGALVSCKEDQAFLAAFQTPAQQAGGKAGDSKTTQIS